MRESVRALLQRISAGEGTFLELKEVVITGGQIRFAGSSESATREIAEVAASFANTEGGTIVFGVTNDGHVAGFDRGSKEKVEAFFVNACRDLVEPVLDVAIEAVELPDDAGARRLCLRVDVPKSRYAVHRMKDGKYLRRIGTHRQPIPPELLGRMLTERGFAAPFEERPAIGATQDDLDRDRFARYYEARFGGPLSQSALPLERVLANQKLVGAAADGTPTPTNLGILLFSQDPARFIPSAYVEIAAYDHDEPDGNARDTKRLHGPVPELVELVLEYLAASPLLALASEKDGAGRLDLPAYHPVALQEAVVNALVHRDYSVASQVLVRLFPTRLEISNPGPLVNTLTPENLFGGVGPIRRNQLLAAALRDYVSPRTHRSYMESRGEGFLSLVRLSQKLSGTPPSLVVNGPTVCLTIFARGPGQ